MMNTLKTVFNIKTDLSFSCLDTHQHTVYHHGCMPHHHHRLITPMVGLLPVTYSHTKKTKQDIISVFSWDVNSELFTHPDHELP